MKKKCRSCKGEYFQYTTLQNKCPKCLAEHAKKTREKKERVEHRKAKESLKTYSDHVSDAEKAVRRFVRARDYGKPCISCRTTNPDVQYAAGHMKTKGAYPELRLMPLVNIFGQCNHRCNKQLSGNINGTKDTIGYRQGLINRFGEWGQELLDYLDGPHPLRKYTVDELGEIKQGFNEWARELEKYN